MASRYDSHKPRMELLPTEGLVEWARAMTFGAEKYGDHNWRKGMAWTRVLGSLSRHLTAFLSGEDRDAESGVNHMAHVMCNAAFLLHYDKHQPQLDDRYKLPKPVEEPVAEPVDDLPAIYFGFENRFLYTFSRREYEAASEPDHWYSVYFSDTPLFCFEDVAEFQTVWNIYTH
jgi:hypothetical protein